MVKEPRPGRTKTRLGRDIGNTAAVWWYRHQCRRLLRNLNDTRWKTVLAVSPDHGRPAPDWPAGLERIPQGKGDIGARMKRLLRSFGPRPTVLIGSDIPDVGRHHISRAFQELKSSDAVFGPASDGGFWLVGLSGLRAHQAPIFDNVRWSTEYALSDCLAGLSAMRISNVDTLDDVDTGDDLLKKKTPH